MSYSRTERCHAFGFVESKQKWFAFKSELPSNFGMPHPVRSHIAIRIGVAFILLLLAFAQSSLAAGQKLGFVTEIYGEGFFLNPLVTKIVVTEVTKGSLAETAGVRSGDLIIQIEGQSVAGKRAFELQRFMKLNPGETRTFRVKHADGTEADARITKPKT